MEEKTGSIGSPITLAELKALGKFVRWQDIDEFVQDLIAAHRLPDAYPLVASRLPVKGIIDLCIGGRWRQVEVIRTEGSRFRGDRQIVYLDEGKEKSAMFNRYGVAPAGHFTEWEGPQPETLAGSELLERFDLAQIDHRIHAQKIEDVDWPYLTFNVTSFDPNARWVDKADMWTGLYTVHAADPRVKVEGIIPSEPWFNTTISVSHRWLHPDHPDPDNDQYHEFIELCERLRLHDNQTFLIDYCSLPQKPRRPDEEAWFRKNLPGFQEQFKYVTVVLNVGSADYAKRAWCMFELMLASMSRASRPTLLNHARLQVELNEAKQLAERYLKQSVWNQQSMAKAFAGKGMSRASFATWSRDLTNVALYNATVQGRRKIIEKFEKELSVTDPDDRPIIIDLLKRLAF